MHPILPAATALLLLAGGCLARDGRPAAPNVLASQQEQVRTQATLLRDPASYDALLELIGNARFVLLGESTHGTHEFYRERAVITERLIEEKGFDAVILEGDWPRMQLVDRYAGGEGAVASVEEALALFTAFPRWMWRNREFAAFVERLRERNRRRSPEDRVHLFGMDLYSLTESADAVIDGVAATGGNPETVRRRYRCFEPYRADPERYGATGGRSRRECERAAQEQLQELQRLITRQAREGRVDRTLLSTFQNARVVKNAEEYYRVAAAGGRSAWNLRDHHMADTIDDVAAYLKGSPSKVVVWAHNSHQGDARATEMSARGEWNVGQLMRRRHGAAAVLVGFTTYTGTVLAAERWGAEGRVMEVRPAVRGSVERLFHDSALHAFIMTFRGNGAATRLLGEARLERAIGVVYRRDEELASHYFRAIVPQQFDAVIHVDTTRAVEPLP